MASLCLKRLAKERERFTTDDSEFWVAWNDTNLRAFTAYIIGPVDSVYAYKLIKLRFDIPDQYPFIPPKVKFIQHTGDRLHPNLYVDGKVCLSILGTWSGPGWSQNMNVECVLRSIRSLLDQQPYTYEPGQSDRPEFNAYVRFHGWRWLLLDYLERDTEGEAKAWLEKYLAKYGSNMIVELERQRDEARRGGAGTTMSNPYARNARHTVDYERLISDLKKHIPHAVEPPLSSLVPAGVAMEDARVKRKLPFETAPPFAAAGSESPAKKPCVVVDLE